MKRLISLLVLVTVFITVAACGFTGLVARTVRGDGDVETEDRNVDSFDRIALSGIGHLTIEQGDEDSLTITAEDNILRYLETEVHGDTLELSVKNGYNIIPTEGIEYKIVTRSLEGISISGLGSADVGEFESDSFKVTISGSGDVDFDKLDAERLTVKISGLGSCRVDEGEIYQVDVHISGSGDYDADDVYTEKADITVSGLGSATLRVEDDLDATISGSGSVKYYGSPSVNSSVSGIGKISQLDD